MYGLYYYEYSETQLNGANEREEFLHSGKYSSYGSWRWARTLSLFFLHRSSGFDYMYIS